MPPRRRSDLELGDIEETGESILVDPRGGKATVLNELATIVWLLCDGVRDAAAIRDEILATRASLGVAPEQLGADVARILAALEAEGLVA